MTSKLLRAIAALPGARTYQARTIVVAHQLTQDSIRTLVDHLGPAFTVAGDTITHRGVPWAAVGDVVYTHPDDLFPRFHARHPRDFREAFTLPGRNIPDGTLREVDPE